jgi:hypothetical protein
MPVDISGTEITSDLSRPDMGQSDIPMAIDVTLLQGEGEGHEATNLSHLECAQRTPTAATPLGDTSERESELAPTYKIRVVSRAPQFASPEELLSRGVIELLPERPTPNHSVRVTDNSDIRVLGTSGAELNPVVTEEMLLAQLKWINNHHPQHGRPLMAKLYSHLSDLRKELESGRKPPPVLEMDCMLRP